MDTNDAKKFLIGYWPLLDYQSFLDRPGDVMPGEQIEDMVERLAKVEVPPVAAVMWGRYPFDAEKVEDTVTIPIFVMDRAADVANHLLEWIEGDTSRFTLHFEQRDVGYAVLLLPDVRKSIERFKAARLMYHEEVVTDNDFVVYYQTLGTCCIGGKTFSRIKGNVPSPCRLGFIELDDVDPDPKKQLELDPSKIVLTGPFNVVVNPDDQAQRHLNHLFETTVEPVKSKLNEQQPS